MSPIKALVVLVILLLVFGGFAIYVHSADCLRRIKFSSIYTSGRSARVRSLGRISCPHAPGSEEFEVWLDGYDFEDRLQDWNSRKGGVNL